jgi:DNA-binding protein HU-beta
MANKKDLVKKMAEVLECSQAQAKDALDTLIEQIKDSLVADGEVNLSPLGKFVVTERAARKGRNPQTGEEIDIPATNVAKFRVSKNLKDAVKNA